LVKNGINGRSNSIVHRLVRLPFYRWQNFSFFTVFCFSFSDYFSHWQFSGLLKRASTFLFLVFNLVDLVAQYFFRGVYRFRFAVASGEYDIDLTKPLPSFFRPVFGWTDILDLIVLVPLIGFFIWFTQNHQLVTSFASWLYFLLLFVNSLVIAFSIHLFVCSVGIITLAIDHLIWIYRSLINMARFPTDIYHQSVQALLTFVVPVVVLITVPAKALLGLLSWQAVLGSFFAGGLTLWASLWFWHFALSRYSSASS
jgi:ABC-2 type transport system permease protein